MIKSRLTHSNTFTYISTGMSCNNGPTNSERTTACVSPHGLQHQQHPVSIRDILGDYFEGGSFGSDSFDAASAAEAVITEISRDYYGSSYLAKEPNALEALRKDYVSEFLPDDLACQQMNATSSEEKAATSMKDLTMLDDVVLPVPGGTDHDEERAEEGSRVADLGRNSDPTTIGPQKKQPDEEIQVTGKLGSIKVCESDDNSTMPQDQLQDYKHPSATTQTIANQSEGAVSPEPIVLSKDDESSERATQQGKPRLVQKKPFLKKGTRKEPSALHRLQQVNSISPVQSNCRAGSNGKSDNLEKLERMQEQQMENLQKRIDRRQRAREEIRRGRGGCKVQVTKQQEVGSERMVRSDKVPISAKNGIEDESSYSDTSHDGTASESSGEETLSSLQTKGEERAEAKQQARGFDQKKQHRKKSVSYSPKRNVRSPVKASCSKLLVKSKGKTSKTVENKFEMPHFEEQWQVIKSMRKRQETALRAAEKDREELVERVFKK